MLRIFSYMCNMQQFMVSLWESVLKGAMQINNMGGSQNYGPSLGVHIKGDVDIEVDIDTVIQIHNMGVLQIMVPFWALGILRHLVFRGPKRGP